MPQMSLALGCDNGCTGVPDILQGILVQAVSQKVLTPQLPKFTRKLFSNGEEKPQHGSDCRNQRAEEVMNVNKSSPPVPKKQRKEPTSA
ncbi:hypothetical protein Pelo_18283 [Pelomyxa schiedti]|nr:hypothetical protein Pelo_18283 [Pelomyxa schiedti]